MQQGTPAHNSGLTHACGCLRCQQQIAELQTACQYLMSQVSELTRTVQELFRSIHSPSTQSPHLTSAHPQSNTHHQAEVQHHQYPASSEGLQSPAPLSLSPLTIDPNAYHSPRVYPSSSSPVISHQQQYGVNNDINSHAARRREAQEELSLIPAVSESQLSEHQKRQQSGAAPSVADYLQQQHPARPPSGAPSDLSPTGYGVGQDDLFRRDLRVLVEGMLVEKIPSSGMAAPRWLKMWVIQHDLGSWSITWDSLKTPSASPFKRHAAPRSVVSLKYAEIVRGVSQGLFTKAVYAKRYASVASRCFSVLSTDGGTRRTLDVMCASDQQADLWQRVITRLIQHSKTAARDPLSLPPRHGASGPDGNDSPPLTSGGGVVNPPPQQASGLQPHTGSGRAGAVSPMRAGPSVNFG